MESFPGSPARRSRPESSLAKIALFTATRVEFNAIARILPSSRSVPYCALQCLTGFVESNEIRLLRTGIGLTRAHSVAQQLLADTSWDLVISTGFAGSLNNSFQVGSLLLGDEVVYQSTPKESPSGENFPIPCDSTWVNRAKNVELMVQSPIQVGRFISVDRILTLAKDKQALGRSTAGIAVDMESGAIGTVAQQCGVPFMIIRAISDDVDEDLPLDFSLFLHPSTWIVGILLNISLLLSLS